MIVRGIGSSYSGGSLSSIWHMSDMPRFHREGVGYCLTGNDMIIPWSSCIPSSDAALNILKEEEIIDGKRSFGEVIP